MVSADTSSSYDKTPTQPLLPVQAPHQQHPRAGTLPLLQRAASVLVWASPFHNGDSLELAEGVLTDPWTEAAVLKTPNLPSPSVSSPMTVSSPRRYTVTWSGAEMIERFRAIAFTERKNVGNVTRCCVCCCSGLDVHFQKFFALDVSPQTTAELLLLFIPSCTYNFNDLSCENTKERTCLLLLLRALSYGRSPEDWVGEGEISGVGFGEWGGDPDAFFSKGAK